MVEVEIREAPRPLPAFVPFSLEPGGVGKGKMEDGSPGGASAGAVNNGAANANSFSDSTSLSPDALFRAYVERERRGGGRNISEEVKLIDFDWLNLLVDVGDFSDWLHD